MPPKLECPAPPKPSNSDMQDAIRKIATSMGVRTCETESKQAGAELGASVLPSILTYDVAVSGSQSKAIGCEQLVLMAQQYINSSARIMCILDSYNVSTQTTTVAFNNITFRRAKLNCKNLNIDQTINLKIVDTQKLDINLQRDVENEMKIYTDNVQRSVQDSKQGFGATPQGQKFASSIQSITESLDYTKQISDTTVSIISTVQQMNNLLFEDFEQTGDECNISQNIILDMIVDRYLSIVNKQVFKSALDQALKTVVDVDQTSDNEGAPESAGQGGIKTSELGAVIGIVVLLAILGFVVMFKNFGPFVKYMIHVVLVVLAMLTVQFGSSIMLPKKQMKYVCTISFAIAMFVVMIRTIVFFLSSKPRLPVHIGLLVLSILLFIASIVILIFYMTQKEQKEAFEWKAMDTMPVTDPNYELLHGPKYDQCRRCSKPWLN